VRELRGEIDVVRNGFNGLEIVREGLPVPFESFGKYGSGNVLDAFHQPD
jgi:hypothetical protein